MELIPAMVAGEVKSKLKDQIENSTSKVNEYLPSFLGE
jgi:hypothetical protein